MPHSTRLQLPPRAARLSPASRSTATGRPATARRVSETLGLFGSALLFPLAAAAQDVEVCAITRHKVFSGSADTRSGVENRLKMDGRFDRLRLGFSALHGSADRVRSPDYRVDKFSLTAGYALSPNAEGFVTYLEISDNLTPTDGGKVYSAQLDARGLPGRLATRLGYHYSDYGIFHVSQFDASLRQSLQWQGFGIGLGAGLRYIDLKRQANPRYIARARDNYLVPHVTLSLGRLGYYARLGYTGRRAFDVRDGGRCVSNGALEIEHSTQLALGRTWKTLDLQLQFGRQQATELMTARPVRIDQYAVRLNYRF